MDCSVITIAIDSKLSTISWAIWRAIAPRYVYLGLCVVMVMLLLLYLSDLCRRKMTDSPQVKAIKQNANDLAELIRGNLTHIANDLKGLRLLGDEDYDRIVNAQAMRPLQRANDLLQCIIAIVKVAPTLYQDFYNILEKHLNPQVLLNILPEPEGESCYTEQSSITS